MQIEPERPDSKFTVRLGCAGFITLNNHDARHCAKLNTIILQIQMQNKLRIIQYFKNLKIIRVSRTPSEFELHYGTSVKK